VEEQQFMADKPDKVDLITPDVAAEKLAVLQDLFPGVVVDGVLDAARLGELVGFDVAGLKDGRERYGLMWAGKHEAVQSLLRPSRGTLIPDVENSVNFNTAENVFVQGDSLEVLKLLQKAYNDQVHLIYVDPPYNTGNDFVYDDDFSDGLRAYLKYTGQLDEDGNRTSADAETAGRWHSRWLSMMYPRLVLARNLLSQEGVLFISIDDNEVASLKHMLDEIFGPENFVGQVVASLNPKGRQLDQFFATSHEYLLVYARDAQRTRLDPTSAELVDLNDFPLAEPDGRRYRRLPLRNTNHKFTPKNRPNLYYPLFGNTLTGEVWTIRRPGTTEVHPQFGDGDAAVWRWSKPLADERRDELVAREVNGRTGTRVDIFQKDYCAEGRRKKLNTVWLSNSVGSTDSAVAELKGLIGPVFQNPKPTKLLQRILGTVPADALVLDFFAGSGTTAHAVALANAADGGCRRCISVNLPEPTAESSEARKAGYSTVADITRARIGTVMNAVEGANKQGLRAYALGESHFAADKDRLESDLLTLMANTMKDADFDPRAISAEVLIKEGVRLDAPWDRTTAGAAEVVVADGVAVVLTTDIGDAVVRGAMDIEPRVLVFLEDGFTDNDSVKANAFYACQQAGITMKTV
jgi:adenine-specific DNA-methyltransferase